LGGAGPVSRMGLGKGVVFAGRGEPEMIEDSSAAAPAKREQSWIAHT
jgi:hypothetical protein